MFEEFVEVAVY
jgi:hypothetical protein